MKGRPLYAALDLPCERSVLGSMNHQGRTQPPVRFLNQAEALRAELIALRRQRRPLHLTLEAGPLTRWACAVARPLVERLVICAPRHNRLIKTNPQSTTKPMSPGCACFCAWGSSKKSGWAPIAPARSTAPCSTSS